MDYFQNISDAFLDLAPKLFNNVGNLISNISPLFASGFGLYMLIVIINAYNRGIDENILDFAKRMAGWLIIIACAFNASQYSKIAHIVYELPDEVARMFSNNSSFSITLFDTSLEKLSQLRDQVGNVGASIPFNYVSTAFGYNLSVNLVVTVCGYIILAVSFAYYAVAKLCLAMVLIVGPFFLGCMLFPATRQYGMNWIGQCLNYIVTVALFVTLSLIQLSFFDSMINKYLLESQNTGDWRSAVIFFNTLPPLFLISTVFFILLAIKIPSIASALTGGGSIEGFTAGLARAAIRSALRIKTGGVLGGQKVGGSISSK